MVKNAAPSWLWQAVNSVCLLIALLAGMPGCAAAQTTSASMPPPLNVQMKRPVIVSLQADRQIELYKSTRIVCTAREEGADYFAYSWYATGGTISGDGPAVTWTTPERMGDYEVTVVVSDTRGGRTGESLVISVIEPATPVVYCMGDSLSDPSISSYPEALGVLLGPNWIVHSEGISGQSTEQMLARFNDSIVAPGYGKYVIIWGGVNDAGEGVDNLTTKSSLQSMYSMAHSKGIKVAAVTISPFKGASSWTQERGNQAVDVNTWIMQSATDIDYRIDAYTLLNDPNNPGALLGAYDDGVTHVHLSANGYQAIAKAIYDTVWQHDISCSWH